MIRLMIYQIRYYRKKTLYYVYILYKNQIIEKIKQKIDKNNEVFIEISSLQ